VPCISVALYRRPDDEGLGLPMKLVFNDVKTRIHEIPLQLLIDKGVVVSEKIQSNFRTR
jgi:hypothetical protein